MGVHRESFKRYVEVGRVVLLSKGENKNKLAVIVEIVDQNRVRTTQPLNLRANASGDCRQPVDRCRPSRRFLPRHDPYSVCHQGAPQRQHAGCAQGL